MRMISSMNSSTSYRATRHGDVEPVVAAAWRSETDRRIAEIESGRVKGVTLEDSLAQARNVAGICEQVG